MNRVRESFKPRVRRDHLDEGISQRLYRHAVEYVPAPTAVIREEVERSVPRRHEELAGERGATSGGARDRCHADLALLQAEDHSGGGERRVPGLHHDDSIELPRMRRNHRRCQGRALREPTVEERARGHIGAVAGLQHIARLERARRDHLRGAPSVAGSERHALRAKDPGETSDCCAPLTASPIRVILRAVHGDDDRASSRGPLRSCDEDDRAARHRPALDPLTLERSEFGAGVSDRVNGGALRLRHVRWDTRVEARQIGGTPAADSQDREGNGDQGASHFGGAQHTRVALSRWSSSS